MLMWAKDRIEFEGDVRIMVGYRKSKYKDRW